MWNVIRLTGILLLALMTTATAIALPWSFWHRSGLSFRHPISPEPIGHYESVDGLRLWIRPKDEYVYGSLIERGRLAIFRESTYSGEHNGDPKISLINEIADPTFNYGGHLGFNVSTDNATIPLALPLISFATVCLFAMSKKRRAQRGFQVNAPAE